MQVNRNRPAALSATRAAVHRLTAAQHEAVRDALYADALARLDAMRDHVRAAWERDRRLSVPTLADDADLLRETIGALAAVGVDPAAPTPICASVAA